VIIIIVIKHAINGLCCGPLWSFAVFSQTDDAGPSLPAALRAVQDCQYLIYSEADFEVFRPAEATSCTDEGEIRHASSMPNFTPIGARTRV